MKKFKYRVESYLKYVMHLRDKAFEDMKKAEAIKLNLFEKMEWMETEMKKSYKTNSEIGKTISNIHFINDNNSFMSMIKKQMSYLSDEIYKAEEVYQEKFKKLVELQTQVKKLELHKENEFNKYKDKIKKMMQKQDDDINARKVRGKDAKSV